MRIVDQTREKGKHSVIFLAETQSDRHVVNEFARVLRDHPVLFATIQQDVRDKLPSLLMEEIE